MMFTLHGDSVNLTLIGLATVNFTVAGLQRTGFRFLRHFATLYDLKKIKF